MVIHLMYNSVFWLNAFPRSNRASDTTSPRYIVTGRHIDYHKHVTMEFGAFVQTHEAHNNDMEARTIGTICLGPSGNKQGGHYFLSLMTGKRLLRHHWTNLPMPDDIIVQVNKMGRAQGMPRRITFADRYGMEITNEDDEYESDGSMSEYDEDSLDSEYYPSESNDGNDNDPDGDDDDPDDNILDNNAPLAPKINDSISIASDDDVINDRSSPSVNNNVSVDDKDDDTKDNEDEGDDNDDTGRDDNVDVTGDGSEDDKTHDMDVQHQQDNTAGVHEEQHHPEIAVNNDRVEDVMDRRYGPRNHSIGLRPH